MLFSTEGIQKNAVIVMYSILIVGRGSGPNFKLFMKRDFSYRFFFPSAVPKHTHTLSCLERLIGSRCRCVRLWGTAVCPVMPW